MSERVGHLQPPSISCVYILTSDRSLASAKILLSCAAFHCFHWVRPNKSHHFKLQGARYRDAVHLPLSKLSEYDLPLDLALLSSSHEQSMRLSLYVLFEGGSKAGTSSADHVLVERQVSRS